MDVIFLEKLPLPLLTRGCLFAAYTWIDDDEEEKERKKLFIKHFSHFFDFCFGLFYFPSTWCCSSYASLNLFPCSRSVFVVYLCTRARSSSWWARLCLTAGFDNFWNFDEFEIIIFAQLNLAQCYNCLKFNLTVNLMVDNCRSLNNLRVKSVERERVLLRRFTSMPCWELRLN